jgi:histidinol-phosphatase
MNPDLELALELADIAAKIALPRFEARDFTVDIKPDGSPVTDVDRAVERALRERLAERRPGHGVLGEEYGPSGDGEWRWFLDPIDGTSRFIEGDAGWMTFVALGRGTDISVGVIAMPARSRRWWATRGDGAFQDGERVTVTTTTQLAQAQINDDWAGQLSGQTVAAVADRAAAIGPHDGEGFMAVATGLADIALAGGGYAWDYAAAKVIVEEAGGRFSDLAGRPRLDAGNALVTNGALHDEVLGALRTDPV